MAGAAHALEFDKWSQADTRRHRVFRDQFGRKWSANVSKKSGRPVGGLSPMFRAPITPGYLQVIPPGVPYLLVDKDEETLVVNYESWARLLIAAHERRHERALAESLEREWADYEQKATGYTPRLLKIIGRAPMPFEPVLAAAQGNKWVLGLSDRVDERLAPFLKPPRRVAARLVDLDSLPNFATVPDDTEPKAAPRGKKEAAS